MGYQLENSEFKTEIERLNEATESAAQASEESNLTLMLLMRLQ